MNLTLLRLATRNVRRNTRRSVITAFVVVLTTAAIISGRGLLNGVTDAIIASVTETITGDVQIHRRGYLEAREALPLQITLPWDDAFRETLLATRGAREAAGRIAFTGLISSADAETTTPFYGRGLEPEREKAITPENFTRVIEGQPLSADDPWGLVVGEALAKSLHLKVGDEVTILANTQAGSLNGKDVHVRGIARMQLPGLANKVVLLPLASVQELLRMPGEVTEVSLGLKDRSVAGVERWEAGLEKRLAESHPELASNTWLDVSQNYLQVFDLWNTVFTVFVATFFVMMVSGVVNTTLMSVMERVREIGMMMAVGVTRRKILQLFVLEALVLTFIGAIFGVLVGGGLVAWYHTHGFYLPMAGNLPKIIHPTIGAYHITTTVVFAHLVALAAALVPVYRSTRMSPVDALAHP